MNVWRWFVLAAFSVSSVSCAEDARLEPGPQHDGARLDGGADSSAAPQDARSCPPPRTTVEQHRAEHACLHTQAGPFAYVEAAGAEGDPPALRHTHTTYTIALPLGSGEGHVGRMRLRAREPGLHALYLATTVAVTAALDDGAPLCPAVVGPVPGCARLARLVAYDLAADREVTLRFGPTTERTVTLVLEREGQEDEGPDAGLP